MSYQMWWQKLNIRLGFFQDERTERVHLVSVGHAYLALLATAFFVGTYLEFFTSRSGVLAATVGLIWLSLLVLIVRRVQLGALGKRDEGIEAGLASAWRYGYLSLSLGIFLYASYRFWLLNDSLGLLAWNFCLISGLLVLVITQILKNSLLGHFWVWGTPSSLLGGIILWNLVIIAPHMYDLAESGGAIGLNSLWLLFLLIPVGGIFVTFVLGAWYSWHNERGERRGD